MTSETPDPDRQFDFWLGEWTVSDEDGERVGSNVIRSVHGGAAIEEQWTGASGLTGSSLSTRDPADGSWLQVWVDAAGRLIELRGGFEGGAMRLEGTLTTAAGERVAFRGTWTPDGPDRVVQHFDYAPTDDTFEPWFHGIYERAED